MWAGALWMRSRETLRLEQLVQKTSASLVNRRDRLANVLCLCFFVYLFLGFFLQLIGIHSNNFASE